MAIDSSFLEGLKRLNFLVKRRVSDIYMGGRRSIKQGRGTDLADHRGYYPGDDFKTIDWRLYGRTEKLYIRRFEEEKDMILRILIDSSASMDFYASGMRKFDYGGSIAAGFAYIALNNYEKFSSALYSDKVMEVMPVRKGKNHFFRMIEVLNGSEQEGHTNLAACIEEYTKMIKSRSFIVIISDFIEPIDSLREGIYRVARYSEEAVLIQVLDPGEIDLMWGDDIDFEDMESLDSRRTYLSPAFKREYRRRLEDHISSIQGICNEAGVDFFSVRTDAPLFDSFVDIIGGRMRR